MPRCLGSATTGRPTCCQWGVFRSPGGRWKEYDQAHDACEVGEIF